MWSDAAATGFLHDYARTASALAQALREKRALEAENAALAMEVAVWKQRAEEAEARERMAWLRRVA